MFLKSEFVKRHFYCKYLNCFLLQFPDSEFLHRHINHPNYDTSFVGFEIAAVHCYDGTWVAAMALNCTTQTLEDIGIYVTYSKG